MLPGPPDLLLLLCLLLLLSNPSLAAAPGSPSFVGVRVAGNTSLSVQIGAPSSDGGKPVNSFQTYVSDYSTDDLPMLDLKTFATATVNMGDAYSVWQSPSKVFDGNKDPAAWKDEINFSFPGDLHDCSLNPPSIIVDLQKVYRLSQVTMWPHWETNGRIRRYCSMRAAYSLSGDTSDFTDIFDYGNSYGPWTNANGYTKSIDSGDQYGRFVQFWLGPNTENRYVHLIEVAIYGVPVTLTTTSGSEIFANSVPHINVTVSHSSAGNTPTLVSVRLANSDGPSAILGQGYTSAPTAGPQQVIATVMADDRVSIDIIGLPDPSHDGGAPPTHYFATVSTPEFREVACDALTGDSSVDCTSVCTTVAQNTCQDHGLEMVIGRSKQHWISLFERFPLTEGYYFSAVPGISKPTSGGNFGNVAMNSDAMPSNGYRAIDGGKWWLRDTAYYHVNGNYKQNCLLSFWSRSFPMKFDDYECNACTGSKYVCSTNSQVGLDLFLNPPTKTVPLTSGEGRRRLGDGAEMDFSLAAAGVTVYNFRVAVCSRLGCGVSETVGTTAPDVCHHPKTFRKNAVCYACPTGYHSLSDNATQCEALCVAGKYFTGYTLKTCVNMSVPSCPPSRGFSSASATISATFEGSTEDDGACTPCAPGRYSAEDTAAPCAACAPGTFAGSVGGASACPACTPGTYQDEFESESCKACISGLYQDLYQQVSIESCKECEPGTYADLVVGGNPNCKDCPVGTNLKDNSGDPVFHDEASDCIDCPVNTYNPYRGLGTECYPW